MSFIKGDRLQYYEITGPLGAGGMGVVYQARDTKLGRDVAIKVLPEDFAANPERLARFQREAKVLASLNHPNIAAIYGLEESDGVHFLVLELVPGETLAERIASGRLSVEEALEIALQIADALEEAHESGIVHRDLKPANVKITPDGKVKVLDFGLAKAFAEESATADSSLSPTLTRDATRAGVILGTAAYMLPEQARGKSVDKRSDIFSFGCVLYEMLTGRKAFDGEEVSDILAAVLKTEPDFEALPSNLHPRLRELLRRCLVKNPKERRRDIGDVRVEIKDALQEGTELPATPISPPPKRSSVLGSVAGALLTGLLVGLVVWFLRPDPPLPLTRFSIVLPEDQQFSSTGRHIVALSPDGTRLAYVANDQLYLRSMDELEAAPVRGTEGGGRSPFFSPDGEWIGFWDGAGSLKKVSVNGGTPVTLCESGNPYGASWESDGTIVYGQGPAGIWRVSENGGEPEVLVAPDSEDPRSYHGPQLLPGGQALLFTVGAAGWADTQIVVQSLETGERHIAIERGKDARYVPTGHLVYFDAGSLFAVPFDPDRLEVTGGPLPVVESVATTVFTGAAHFGFSRTGTLAFVPELAVQTTRRLEWRDRNGAPLPSEASVGIYTNARIAPDGTRVAIARRTESGEDIWLLHVERGTWTRLTFEGTANWPMWTADGTAIVFTPANKGLFSIPSDGSGTAARLTDSEFTQHADTISSDGRWLVYHEHDLESQQDMWVLDLEGQEEPRPFLRTEFAEIYAALSPDGRWLAYQSDESGSFQIYVQPFPGPGGKYQISAGGGTAAVWVRQEELIYQSGRQVMSVAIETSPSFSAATPEPLFARTLAQTFTRDYDVTRDAQQFLILEPESAERRTQQVNIVLNWFDELKRLAPSE